ncbi:MULTISPECIES: neutral/alkaline non-lysosomal ceramidase N-terminal domain-containing protein [unclassified Agromyces]|uniref:neutral/alkaline non-lysosomal ceramidase N-terminal domain-containing protein n=1 Tax=unclassified Agromyces TaxID=2639701 RepID=UPI0030147CB4
MEITNRFGEPVCVYQYTPGDLLWALTVDGGPPLALAHSELPIHVGGMKELFDAGHLGVKRGVGGPLAAFEPYLGTPTSEVYPSDAQLEIDAAGEIVWLNRPREADPTPRLDEEELRRPLPDADGYVVGVGLAEVTDAAAYHDGSSLPLQGWADPGQLSSGVESPLMARAFIVGDPSSGERVVLVVADIWSCSIALKEAVIERLGGDGIPYRMDNVHIAGTHTHSGLAGYTHHLLYNLTAGGFDPHVFESLVCGIVAAIERAHVDLAPGTVRVSTGDLRGVGFNRSLEAFQRNPEDVRRRFPEGVDERMTLLRFDHGDPRSGDAVGIGAINWFAVHPTNRGEANTLVNGDNKGWASIRFEERARELPQTRTGFVAAFANSAAGDVSGNFDASRGVFDPVPDGREALQAHAERMRDVGERQAEFAMQLFERAESVLKGPIGSVHQRINLVERTGAWGALGLSMGAGSTEDGGPGPVPEGLRLDADGLLEVPDLVTTGALSAVASYVVDPIVQLLLALPNPVAWMHSLARSVADETFASDGAHHPKPIMLRTGATRPKPLTPNVVPLQLIRIGDLVLLSVPAEPTTAAGLAMQRAVAKRFTGAGVGHVVVGGYANGYASYITTEAEYRAQHYEGASTLHGPRTCDAYAGAFAGLASALRNGTAPAADDPPPFDELDAGVFTKTRMTFRNHTAAPMRVRIFLADDRQRKWALWAGGEFEVGAARTEVSGEVVPSDRALVFPLHLAWLQRVQVEIESTSPRTGRTTQRTAHARTNELVSLLPDGRVASGPYVAQRR